MQTTATAPEPRDPFGSFTRLSNPPPQGLPPLAQYQGTYNGLCLDPMNCDPNADETEGATASTAARTGRAPGLNKGRSEVDAAQGPIQVAAHERRAPRSREAR